MKNFRARPAYAGIFVGIFMVIILGVIHSPGVTSIVENSVLLFLIVIVGLAVLKKKSDIRRAAKEDI
jgi:uncharacterized membrane protein YdjX (TVP38/TMEM64 family)